jgi:hypothetical protein
MSKNTNLSFLTDFLTADIVNSRVGMNNASPQNTFDVTGTGKFSGILTLGSTVSNGTYTYTLPSATGTLALTSDIPSVSGYVPYTGAAASVNLGVYSITANAINSAGSGSTAGQINLRSDAFFSLVNGYGSIASGTTNQFNLYQTTGAGVFRGAILSLNSITESATRTFTFPDASGTIALTSSIPANPVGGTGTTNFLPKFTGTSTIGNSLVYDNGTNVGINTATPLAKLSVKLATATAVSTIANTTGWDSTYVVFGNPDSVTGQGFGISVNNTLAGVNLVSVGPLSDWVDTNYYSRNHIFYGGGTEKMRLDASGNLGLGVTPSAWENGSQAFQNSNYALTNFGLTRNAFWNGASWNYMTSDVAARFDVGNGAFRWNIAPSNIGVISFTQAMALTSGGNLLVGTTTDNGARLQVSGQISIIDNTNNSPLNWSRTGGPIGYLYSDGDNVGITNVFDFGAGYEGILLNTSSSSINFYTDGVSTPRLTIASTGAATFSSSVTATGGTASYSTSALPTATISTTTTGAINAAYTSIRIGARGQSGQDQSIAITNVPTADGNSAIAFTTMDSYSYAERMRITSDGLVGIGTASPSALLHIQAAEPTLRITDSNDGGVMFIGNTGGFSYIRAFSRDFRFLNAVGTSLLGVNANGNVLIGTTTDNGFKFDVAGTGRFNGNALTVSGSNPSLTLTTSDSTLYSYVALNAGTASNVIYTLANSYVTTGPYIAGALALDGTTSAGISIAATNASGLIRFYTGGTTEKMRITSGGYFKASSTGAYVGSTGPYHEIIAGGNDSDLLFTRHTAASPYGIEINFSGASPNNTTNWFTYYYDTTNVKFIVYSNGNVVNRNGSYGTISDVKYKENIVNASEKLDDILKLQVRNFNLIGDDKKQIGFIAQEFEEVFPSMVDTSIDKNTNEEYKSIKTSVLIPMLVKAIQEQQEQIQKLKNKLS